jgi:hypothetical protein
MTIHSIDSVEGNAERAAQFFRGEIEDLPREVGQLGLLDRAQSVGPVSRA